MNRMIVNETSSALKIASTNQRAFVFSQTLAFVASFISILVLSGWIFEIDFLKRIVPGYVMMNPTTAVLFILLSAGLWLLQSDDVRRVRIAQACGAIVLLGGLFKLFEGPRRKTGAAVFIERS